MRRMGDEDRRGRGGRMGTGCGGKERQEEQRRRERCERARVLAYSDLNHHHQIHLGRSPEERAVQRATGCTLSTH